MAQIIGVVVPEGTADTLEEQLAEEAGLEADVDDWEGKTVYLDAPFTVPGGDALVLLTVPVDDDDAAARLAGVLGGRDEELLLIDVSTGDELGRLTPAAAAGDVRRVIAAARAV
ncbi:hypothetical protein Aab01nite_07600 [Paractinoplanes abujensis]|uniref:Uncharacterized protein n=1 Tax=Paractinoplanes abujensis TaxID=882441 RepID=A0A7W7G0A6_9ACTN|nr:hypothetical protein [Actinoplanes abujensis]MBB4691417.1 hypothetical protein [Actinoplanes abujensis]GID17170.1 hypothetical protein Aab01nite_07600 [Actinoplanes abujensis]